MKTKKEPLFSHSLRATFSILIVSISISLPSFIVAATSYPQIKEKIEKNFSLIERLKINYPAFKNNTSIITRLKRDWNNQKSDFRRATVKSKNSIIKKMTITYYRMETLLKRLSLTMEKYSEDILLDFNDRLNEKKNEEVKPEQYAQRMQVGKQEFVRAKRAHRRKQYAFSIHLYDRGINIIQTTYKKLNWSLPPTYQKN